MSRATIMAVVNQKGGTGKTTTCENLGIGLANEGKRVLLVDTDPQASLTIALGHPRPDDLPVTLTDLMAKVMQDQPIAPKEGILSHEEGVDLVPANITLSGMEVSLVNAMSRETVLRQVLDALKFQYDYILLDCMPYSDTRLLNVLSHTLWFMPNVASCYAMANLLAQKQNAFYHDYKVNVCAGTQAGIGVAALEPVRRSMGDPLETKTITLSCGKLTTGVTIRPWTGIFMLRNLSSPETYFQAAFRVQSPWEITKDNGEREIVKQECYVFDFALDRALRQISDYSCRLNVAESNPEKKVGEFINFLPVLAYDGSAMRQVNAAEILDIAMAGTSATLLAKRWESALLVNVDNDTLARLLASEEAMDALMRIEGFRSLNADIETIINKSNAVKKAKRDGEKLTPKEKKELTDAENKDS